MDYGKYENKLEYPERLKKPFLAFKHTAAEAAEYAKQMVKYEEEMVSWRAKKKIYNIETSRLEELFKVDALEEVGLADHKNADKAYALAWEDGHSEGLEAVFHRLEELAEVML